MPHAVADKKPTTTLLCMLKSRHLSFPVDTHGTGLQLSSTYHAKKKALVSYLNKYQQLFPYSTWPVSPKKGIFGMLTTTATESDFFVF